MPAVTPRANAANVTCTLFAMMRLAITGRRTCGSSMYPVPTRARETPSSARSSMAVGMKIDATRGSRTTAVYAMIAGPKRNGAASAIGIAERRTSVGTSIAMKRRMSRTLLRRSR